MSVYFQGGVRAGSNPSEVANAFGYAVFAQTTTATTTADGLAVSSTLTLPAGSQIVDYYVDGTVAASAGAGTATAIAVTVGTAAAGTQYMTSTDGIAGGRLDVAKTVAQVLAMSDIGTNT